MKKLLKNFAILTVFACGLFTGCNNDASIDLNVTVSTDKPSLDEPKNLGYGVLLTWGITQDANYFRVTRQEKDGEEKILDEFEGNRYVDAMNFYNELKEGVEYTYRVYNLGDKTHYNYEDDSVTKGSFYYGDNCVVKTSFSERKITLQAGTLKKQGDKLEAVNKDNVKTSFKNGTLRIYLNDENRIGNYNVVVRDAETGKKVKEEEDSYYSSSVSFWGISAQKVNVEIKNVSYDGYYADSDVVKIENIENIAVEESIPISNLTATRKGGIVVLTWITSGKIEPSELKVLRTKQDSSKPEVLKITPTYEELYDGRYYWTAIDETVEVGTGYKYEVITTDSNSNPDYVYGQGFYGDISLDVSVNGYSYSSISDEKDDILLSFDNDDKNLTYKGYWATVDNKGNESARTEFAFIKDNDEHYRKAFKASEFANLKKSVRVNFYVKCYNGDALLGHWEWDDYHDESVYVYEYNESVSVSKSFTTYTALNYINAYQEDSKKQIIISAYGYNFKDVIKVTYFKDDGEVKTANNLIWEEDPYDDSHYTTTLAVDEYGYYTICATVPEDNAYSSSYSYERTNVSVYEY